MTRAQPKPKRVLGGLAPARAQWKRWSYPSKATYIGAAVSVLSAILAIMFFAFPRAADTFSLSNGPNGLLFLKDSLKGFKREALDEASMRAQDSVDRATVSFVSAEMHFSRREYQPAAEDYRKAIAAVPTVAAYMNLCLSEIYLHDTAAKRDCSAGLDHAVHKGRRDSEANFHVMLASVERAHGQLGEAAAHADRAVSLARQLGLKPLLSVALSWKARLDFCRGETAAAASEGTEAYGGFQASGNLIGQADICRLQITIGIARGETGPVFARVEELLARMDRSPDKRIRPIRLQLSAYLHYARFELQEAHSDLEAASGLFVFLGDRVGQATCLAQLAATELDESRVDSARAHILKAMSLNITDIPFNISALYELSRTHEWKGELDQARAFTRKSIDLAREHGDSEGEAEGHMLLGVIEDEIGNAGQALFESTLALNVIQRRSVIDTAVILNNIGIVQYEKGNYQESEDLLRRSLGMLSEHSNKAVIVATLHSLATLLRKTGRYEESLKYFQIAVRILDHFHSPKLEAEVLGGIGLVYQQQGKREEAIRLLTKAKELADTWGFTSRGIIEVKFALERAGR
jgi:tetratricopeptide (TPR) repeat protein